jgi:hypothetical protein
MAEVICPVCGHQSSHATADLFRCGCCDHIFQWPPEVTASYNYDYVHSRYDQYETAGVMSHLRLGLVAMLAKGPHLLDVGYGNGDFIKLAEKVGFKAWGNDVHGQGARYLVKETKLDAMPYRVRKWDVVTFFDSLEHFPYLAPIKELNNRCTSVVVSVPARPLTFPDDLNWKHYRPGEHLHYFTIDSLNRLFYPKKVIHVSSIEDVVRGDDKKPNIWTVVFSSKG